jgi:hypothetical protein
MAPSTASVSGSSQSRSVLRGEDPAAARVRTPDELGAVGEELHLRRSRVALRDVVDVERGAPQRPILDIVDREDLPLGHELALDPPEAFPAPADHVLDQSSMRRMQPQVAVVHE